MHAVPKRSLLVLVAVFLVPLFVLSASGQNQENPDNQEKQEKQEKPEKKRQNPVGFPPGLAEARLVKERAKEIGLDEEILEKLEALVAETRAKEQELSDQLKESSSEVVLLLDTGRPSEKAVLEASAVGSDIARESRMLKLQLTLKVRALLNNEQLAKFMELRKRAMKNRRGRGGRGGRPRR